MADPACDERFVGVDAGGTCTRAVCMTADGTILGRGRAGSANHTTVGIARARTSISDAIVAAIPYRPPDARACATSTFIGSAGLEHAGEESEGRLLLDERIRSLHVAIDSDAYAAWAGAFRGQPGIIVVAGTGSMCLGIDAAGTRVKVGGWGWRAGDEGSAYGIAIEAIRAALQTADGRGDAPALWQALQSFVSRAAGEGRSNDADILTVRAWLYDPNRNAADIAAFAPLVDRAASVGCATSIAILQRAGAELATMVRAVAKQLADGSRLPVAVMGGVLRRSSAVRVAFCNAIEDMGCGSSLEPAYAPEIGAALLAIQAAGGAFDPALIARLDAADAAPTG